MIPTSLLLPILCCLLSPITADDITEPAEKIVSLSGNSSTLTLKTKTGSTVSEQTGNEIRIEITDLQTGRPLPAKLFDGLLTPNSDAEYSIGDLTAETWYGILFHSIMTWPIHHVYSENRIFRTHAAGGDDSGSQVKLNVTQRITGK